jgi:hypothetical protein
VVIGIAVDEDADRIRPHAEGISFPILLDRDHRVCELLSVTNIPTVLWVDERGRIAVPNAEAFGSDTFIEFTGVSGEPHKAALRGWAAGGDPPLPREEAAGSVPDFTEDEVRGHLHWRVAATLRRMGREDAAAVHFARAGELAPNDFTVTRAALPLQGKDPFGQDFFTAYEAWKAAGKPYHGLGAERFAADDDR